MHFLTPKSMKPIVLKINQEIPWYERFSEKQIRIQETTLFPQDDPTEFLFGSEVLIVAETIFSLSYLGERKCKQFNITITILHEGTNQYHHMGSIEFMQKITWIVKMHLEAHQTTHKHNEQFNSVNVMINKLVKLPYQPGDPKREHLLQVIKASKKARQAHFYFQRVGNDITYDNDIGIISSFFLCSNVGIRIEDKGVTVGFHRGMLFQSLNSGDIDVMQFVPTRIGWQDLCAHKLMQHAEKLIQYDIVFFSYFADRKGIQTQMGHVPYTLSSFNKINEYLGVDGREKMERINDMCEQKKSLYWAANESLRPQKEFTGLKCHARMIEVAREHAVEILSVFAAIKLVNNFVRDQLPISCKKALLFELRE